MEKLKIAIIGVGGISGAHIDAYQRNPHAELYAFCDINKERLEQKGAMYGITRLYTDEDEMLAALPEIDAVSVCVWNCNHAKCAIKALDAGKHVLCEKPIAKTVEEAEQMLAAAKRNNRLLMVGFCCRFGKDAEIIRNYQEKDFFGDIYYAKASQLRRNGNPGGWFCNKAMSGGGPLIDLGVHRLDLALWLMGYPKPVWVMASTYAKFGPELGRRNGLPYTVEDLACAMIKFENGATLELDASWASNIKENELQTIRLLGDKGGMYQYNLNEGYTYDVEYYSEIAGRQFDSKMHTADDMPSAFQLFADAVRDNTPFLVQPEDGVTVMRILDAIYRSANSGAPEKIL